MNIISMLFSSFLFLTSCSGDDAKITEELKINNNTTNKAQVVSVAASGQSGAYVFNVGIASPDTGCEHYANWWEIISEDGTRLIYRRILGHSHVNEQPFVRSGGSVPITNNQIVIVRAHMNTSGYGTVVFKGSVSSGFIEATVANDFASNLSQQQPLPNTCAF